MKKASFKTHFVIYILALVIAVTTGSILKLQYTNFENGLLVVRGSGLGTALSYVFNLSLILPILFWFTATMSRRARHDYPLSYRHRISGILSIITGIAILTYTFVSARLQVIDKSIATTQFFGAIPSDFKSKMQMLAVVILGIIACISMVVGGRNKYSISGKPGAVLGFVPALWQMVILLSRFVNFIAITTVVDHLLVVMFMCFASMFLIGQSRIIFGLGIRNGKTYALPTGFAVSLIGLTFVLTNLICYMFTGVFATILDIEITEIIYMLSLSIYSVVFLRGFSKSIKVV